MRDEVRRALAQGESLRLEDRIIDITTTGRRSGQPRRIETCFYGFEDAVYLSGVPRARVRDWLVNLIDEPHFVFHLTHGVVADLPAVAEVVTDPAERRRVLTAFVDDADRRNGAGSADLEEWVSHSPLAKVDFLEDGSPDPA